MVRGIEVREDLEEFFKKYSGSELVQINDEYRTVSGYWVLFVCMMFV